MINDDIEGTAQTICRIIGEDNFRYLIFRNGGNFNIHVGCNVELHCLGAVDIRKNLHNELITEVSSFYCFFFQFYDFMRTNKHGKKKIFIECFKSRFTNK